MSPGPGDGTEIRVLICEGNHRCIAAARHHTQTPSGCLSPVGEDLTPAHLKESAQEYCFFSLSLLLYFFPAKLSFVGTNGAFITIMVSQRFSPGTRVYPQGGKCFVSAKVNT